MPHTFVKNGMLYTTRGGGLQRVTAPVEAIMRPAVVTAETYLKKETKPREVTPDDIYAEMEKLTLRPRPMKKK
jgi:hypothetical protein